MPFKGPSRFFPTSGYLHIGDVSSRDFETSVSEFIASNARKVKEVKGCFSRPNTTEPASSSPFSKIFSLYYAWMTTIHGRITAGQAKYLFSNKNFLELHRTPTRTNYLFGPAGWRGWRRSPHEATHAPVPARVAFFEPRPLLPWVFHVGVPPAWTALCA